MIAGSKLELELESARFKCSDTLEGVLWIGKAIEKMYTVESTKLHTTRVDLPLRIGYFSY